MLQAQRTVALTNVSDVFMYVTQDDLPGWWPGMYVSYKHWHVVRETHVPLRILMNSFKRLQVLPTRDEYVFTTPGSRFSQC